VGRFEAGAERIFPGSSVRSQFQLGALAAGTYQALVIADAGDVGVFGARYTLEVTAP
jgi:hypothetical protein